MTERLSAQAQVLREAEDVQGGTRKHIDCDVTNPSDPRPFQAFVALTDAVDSGVDGSLRVVPGFHRFFSDYFRLSGGVQPRGGYFGLNKDQHGELVNTDKLWSQIRRISPGWSPPEKGDPLRIKNLNSKDDIVKCLAALKEEIDGEFYGDAIKEGDYVLWDPRMVHTTGEEWELNRSQGCRAVFYCSFMRSAGNEAICAEQTTSRSQWLHPQWAPSSHASLETKSVPRSKKGSEPELQTLTDLGMELYGQTKRKKGNSHQHQTEEIEKVLRAVTAREVAFLRRFGYVVIEDLVEREHTRQLRKEIFEFIETRSGISLSVETCRPVEEPPDGCGLFQIKKIFSATGMLEAYWLPTMDTIRQLPQIIGAFRKLFRETWGTLKGIYSGTVTHPSGGPALNIYVDRAGVRLPWEKLLSHVVDTETESVLTSNLAGDRGQNKTGAVRGRKKRKTERPVKECWLECEKCKKWRLAPKGTKAAAIKYFECGMVPLPEITCDTAEEKWSDGVDWVIDDDPKALAAVAAAASTPVAASPTAKTPRMKKKDKLLLQQQLQQQEAAASLPAAAPLPTWSLSRDEPPRVGPVPPTTWAIPQEHLYPPIQPRPASIQISTTPGITPAWLMPPGDNRSPTRLSTPTQVVLLSPTKNNIATVESDLLRKRKEMEPGNVETESVGIYYLEPEDMDAIYAN